MLHIIEGASTPATLKKKKKKGGQGDTVTVEGSGDEEPREVATFLSRHCVFLKSRDFRSTRTDGDRAESVRGFFFPFVPCVMRACVSAAP